MNFDNIRRKIFIVGLFLLAVAVPTSETGVTASMIILLVGWLIDNKLFTKIRSFFSNRIALSFSLIYFVHLIWLANTSDFDYAVLDLRTKFSVFLFALIFSTSPLISGKEFRNLMLVHALTVFIATIIGVYRYYNTDSVDFRNFSPYISHIRFALNICIAVFTFIYYTYYSEKYFSLSHGVKQGISVIFSILAGWLIVFLILMQSFTGLLIIGFVVFIGFIRYLFSSSISKSVKITILILTVGIPLAGIVFLYNSYNQYTSRPGIDFSKLERTTNRGNEYIHDTIVYGIENGKWTGLYICEKEMREAWNKRSNMKYDSLDGNGFYVSSTVIRYLTSMELRKDLDGINALTDEDVTNIEKGIATKESLKGFGVKSRLNTIFFELMRYRTEGEIKGSSMIQRYELLKNSTYIIYDNFFTGVGTGDVPNAFRQQLHKSGSPLKDTRMRSHNQYLSLFVAFGILGFILCLISLTYPYLKSGSYRSYFTIVFLLIFLLSNLTEDTIESLSGATFYAFFGALYLFQQPRSLS